MKNYALAIVMLLIILPVVYGEEASKTPNEAAKEDQDLTQASLTQMFFGVLVLSFIIERFFEISSSIMEYVWCGKSESKEKRVVVKPIFEGFNIKTEIDEKKVKNFETTKKLLFTPVGLVLGYWLVSTTIANTPTAGLLHAARLLPAGDKIVLDTILTAVVISWGTGPIHQFIGALTGQADKQKEKPTGSQPSATE